MWTLSNIQCECLLNNYTVAEWTKLHSNFHSKDQISYTVLYCKVKCGVGKSYMLRLPYSAGDSRNYITPPDLPRGRTNLLHFQWNLSEKHLWEPPCILLHLWVSRHEHKSPGSHWTQNKQILIYNWIIGFISGWLLSLLFSVLPYFSVSPHNGSAS